MLIISKETSERLNKYPVLKSAVDSFITNDGRSTVPGNIADLTYYIKLLHIDVPKIFHWKYRIREEFCSWGPNSRYSNVLQPQLYWNLDDHLKMLLDYLDKSGVKEPNIDS